MKASVILRNNKKKSFPRKFYSNFFKQTNYFKQTKLSKILKRIPIIFSHVDILVLQIIIADKLR